jgi:hypothetical protein
MKERKRGRKRGNKKRREGEEEKVRNQRVHTEVQENVSVAVNIICVRN